MPIRLLVPLPKIVRERSAAGTLEQRAQVRIAMYARSEVITVGFSQCVHTCSAVLLACLSVVVTVPIVKTRLFCHGKVTFLILGPHGPLAYSGHPRGVIGKSQARLQHGHGVAAFLEPEASS